MYRAEMTVLSCFRSVPKHPKRWEAGRPENSMTVAMGEQGSSVPYLPQVTEHTKQDSVISLVKGQALLPPPAAPSPWRGPGTREPSPFKPQLGGVVLASAYLFGMWRDSSLRRFIHFANIYWASLYVRHGPWQWV